MAWVETLSLSFTARHEAAQADDAVAVLDALEIQRERLLRLFGRVPSNVTVVLHDSAVQLGLAQPYLPLARRSASPAARRYMAGWFSNGEVHSLSPAVLRRIAAGADSHEALMLTPQRVYTMLVVGHNNRGFPPPFRPRAILRLLRESWLPDGAAQYLTGQVPLLRAAMATRLRTGAVRFPPGPADAALVAGALFDLLAREGGPDACVRLARQPLREGAVAALESAFERPAREIAERWRAHLERLATPAADVTALAAAIGRGGAAGSGVTTRSRL